jgi:ABC-type transport system involved in multi-copper enzyme maturation permease subunit
VGGSIVNLRRAPVNILARISACSADPDVYTKAPPCGAVPMANPVLYQEFVLGARRNQAHFIRWFYGAWILVQAGIVSLPFVAQRLVSNQYVFGYEEFAHYSRELLEQIVLQNYLVLLIASPVLTAGAITDEKWRGTLQYLLVTDLQAWEILLGKLIARQSQVVLIALTPLMLVCFICVFGGLDLSMLLAIGVSSAAMSIATGSMSLLASVVCRNTRDAVLAFYMVGAAFYAGCAWLKTLLAGISVGGSSVFEHAIETVLTCLDPLHPMGEDWAMGTPSARAGRVAASVAAWSLVGSASFILAAGLLRRCYLNYLERDGQTRWKPVWGVFAFFWTSLGVAGAIAYTALTGTLLNYLSSTTARPMLTDCLLFLLVWNAIGLVPFGIAAALLSATGRAPAFLVRFHALINSNWLTRPARVGDNPVTWKARDREGLAPIAALRTMPRWLGVALVLAASSLACLTILIQALPPEYDTASVARMLYHGDFAGIYFMWQGRGDAEWAFAGMGFVVLLLGSLVVCVRASGLVSGERERNTWEALLLTPLETRQLVRGKLWGVFSSALVYLAAFAAVALIAAGLCGLASFFWVAAWVGMTVLALWFVSAAGIWCSVVCKTSWRSLLATLGITYVGGFVLFWLTSPLLLILMMILLFVLMAIDALLERYFGISLGINRGGGPASAVQIMMVSWCLLMVGFFALMAWRFTVAAEYRVGILERTKHWRDEAKHPRWSKHARQRERRQHVYDVEETVDEAAVD